MDLNNPAHPGHSNYLISTNGYRAEQIFEPEQPLEESTIEKLLVELESHWVERCGFIDSTETLWNVENSHERPHHNFYMTPSVVEDTIASIYDQFHLEILGIYHTHPNNYPWPSPRDIAGWPNQSLGWRYFLITRGCVTEWRLVCD